MGNESLFNQLVATHETEEQLGNEFEFVIRDRFNPKHYLRGTNLKIRGARAVLAIYDTELGGVTLTPEMAGELRTQLTRLLAENKQGESDAG